MQCQTATYCIIRKTDEMGILKVTYNLKNSFENTNPGENMFIIITGTCLIKRKQSNDYIKLVRKDIAGQNNGYSIGHLRKPFS